MNHIMSNLFEVDLVIIIVACLLVFYGETWAGIFAFSQGFLIDIFSGGLLGLSTFLYLTVFFIIILVSRFFDLHSLSGQILVISLAVLLKEILFIGLLKVLSLEVILSFPVFLAFTTSAICTGLIGPFIFYIFNQISHFFIGRMRGSSDGRI